MTVSGIRVRVSTVALPSHERNRPRSRPLTTGILLFLLLWFLQPAAEDLDTGSLGDLSLEELADIRVTSVSKRVEKLSDAAASIFVITAEDIRRSGVTTIPEILRLAPNLQVARRDSVQYAVTARGFNNAVGNKMLVLIDGRTIYTPLFSGVFWEMQDTMLEDIDRVEVISGPGATLWGANAVNGVINIITRSSAETQGYLFSGDAGSTESGLALRAGGRIGDTGGTFRVYAKMRDWDATKRIDGLTRLDQWDREQVGFRADWRDARQDFTIQGDAYRGETGDRGIPGVLDIPAAEMSGINLLARWSRRFKGGASIRLQTYWDYTKREEIILFQPEADIFDIEFHHGIPLGGHRILWGGGYRRASDKVEPGFFTAFIPDERDLEWENIFIQDEIELGRNLQATIGIKLEWNDYTGMEYLPSGRLAWKPDDDRLVWASASRAVRAPSRFDRDVFTPAAPPFIVAGGPDFRSEIAHVVEVGYRANPTDRFTYSITAYYHDWDHLRSGTPLPLPVELANNIKGEAYGVESWASWQVTDAWRLTGGITLLDKNLEFKPGTSDTVGTRNATLHNDPDYQWMVRSSFDLPHNVMLDLHLRGVDALTIEPIPDYTELDVRLAWIPMRNVEFSVVGRNLLHEHHFEFGPPSSRHEIDRSVLLKLQWRH